MDLSGDLSKLKVVELKAELAARGLDTKGIKAMLVSRLEAALAAEKSGVPITSVASDAPTEATECDADAAMSDATSEAVEPSPARPTRRRRTRSMTRSPSPEAKRLVTEQVLEPLREEETEPTPAAATESQEESKEEEPAAPMEVDSAVPEAVAPPSDDAAPTTTDTNTQESHEQKEPETQETEDENKGQKRSRENSKSPSRKRSSSVEPHSNDFTNDEDEPEIDDSKFLLSWFDSDLHLKIDQTDFLHAKPISDAGLNLVWAGARANHGVKSGKVAYEVYLSNYNRVNHSQEDRRIHEFRCGWSVGDTSLQLGECPLSFGFDSNGKKCTDSKFEDYGKRYSLFDVVGVYLDLDSSPCTIEYTINGETQGKAFEFEKDSLEGKALFPHISTKNIGYKVNFGQVLPTLYSSVPNKPKDNRRDRNSNRRPNDNNKNKNEDSNKKESEPSKDTQENTSENQEENQEQATENNGEQQQNTENTEENATQETNEEQPSTEETQGEAKTAEESDKTAENAENKPTEEEEKPGSKELLPGYIFIDQSPADALEDGPKRPESRKDCEVILMIGLPGTGKTFYARNWVKEHPEKRYNAFGVQFLLEKMKISGEARKPSQSYRWSQIVESLSRSLNILLNIACRRRRNYIFDQPNVYANLQRRKMSRFGDFHRKAVIVFPDEETHKERAAKRLEEQGKEYSPINEEEMRSKLSLPVLEHTWFNEIVYTELPEEKAREIVVKINEDGQAARKKRKEGRDDRSRQRYQKFQDNRRDPWRPQGGRGPAGAWDRRPGEGYGYGRPDRFRDQWGNQNNWVRGGQGYQRQSMGGNAGGGRFDQNRRQDDRRRSQLPDNKRQKQGGDKGQWASNNWSAYGQGGGNFGQGGWAQQWPPQGGQGANGNQYGGTWW